MDLKNFQQFSSTSPPTKTLNPNHKTKGAGRKISKDTRHPVRRNNKSRICVGSFPGAETALRGENAPLNFKASSHPIPHELQINEEPNKDDFEICGHDHVEITRGDGEESEVFVDEEAMFNMPVLLDSMAEGMLLTPLAMKKGFNWDQYDHHHDLLLDFNLWT